jgi:glutathione S-transferase
MKLYYSPGACSMAVHIALSEAGIPVDLVMVDLATHKLADGTDYYTISPRGYVPLLELDDGSRHTEASALLQYVGDLDTTGALLPRAGTRERLETVGWLAFIATEIHKGFSPLWRSDTPASVKETTIAALNRRFADLDARLAKSETLTGKFSVADAYAFTVVGWSRLLSMSLASFPNLEAYLARIAARPKVVEALKAEGLA